MNVLDALNAHARILVVLLVDRLAREQLEEIDQFHAGREILREVFDSHLARLEHRVHPVRESLRARDTHTAEFKTKPI